MCKIVEDKLNLPDLKRIVDLVNTGCFTALSCNVSDILDEGRQDESVIILINHLLECKDINSMPFEKELLTTMHTALTHKITHQVDKISDWSLLPHGKPFFNKLKEVYENYVIGYYQTILEKNDTK